MAAATAASAIIVAPVAQSRPEISAAASEATAIAHVWFDAGRERVRIGAEFFHCGRGANMSQPMDDSAA